MLLSGLTEPVIRQAIEEFYGKASTWVTGVSTIVSNASFALRRTPRRVGRVSMGYFYGAELYELFEYAIGRREMSAGYVDKQCEQLMELLTRSISGAVAPLDWSTFAGTPLGLCILACGARIALRVEDGTIALPQILILSGVTAEALTEAGLTANTDADADGAGHYQCEQVRDLFAEKGLPI